MSQKPVQYPTLSNHPFSPPKGENSEPEEKTYEKKIQDPSWGKHMEVPKSVKNQREDEEIMKIEMK